MKSENFRQVSDSIFKSPHPDKNPLPPPRRGAMLSGRSARHKRVAHGFASPEKIRSRYLPVVGDESARRRGVIIMAYRAAQSEDNKSDHHKKNWTFFPIVPFCLGGLCREPDVSGRRVRPVVLISPEYGRRGRRSAPDMAIIMMYVVTKRREKGRWTE